MDFYIIQFIKSLILPPGNIFFLLLITIFVFKSSTHYARLLLICSCTLFYIMSTPLVATALIDSLEDYPAVSQDNIENSNAQAIVILGGGRERDAAEFGKDIVSLGTFERLRYGAYLHSKTNLPILVTGGFINPEDTPEGLLMAQSLEQDFKISARWQENRSRNTAENAIYTREMLKTENIDKIFLVTKAWHLSRAVSIFEQQGFTVIPAPTGFSGFNPNQSGLSFYDFMPAGYAIQTSAHAIHELFGRAWYFIRY